MGARREIDITPQIDADGIALSQTLAGGGVQAFVLNGAFVVDGVASFIDSSHIVEFVQAADETGRTYTISGTDSRDVAITESVLGSAGTASSTKYFKTITSITIDANSAGAITIGSSGLCVSQWILMNQGQHINIGFTGQISSGGSLTWGVEHTFADLQSNTDLEIVTEAHSDVNLELANATGNYQFPATAYRLAISAFTSGTMKFISWEAY